MSDKRFQDWDPKSAAVLRDQRAAFDEMRERCPVAYSDLLGWSLFRHEDIVRVLNDPITFSSVVSRNLSVPNGMDPPEHGQYRRLIEPYFAPHAMQTFEPQCRSLAADLVRSLQGRAGLDLMADFAQPFAVRVQCAFLGWPASMHEPLRSWAQKNHAATFAQDRPAMADLAQEFAGYVMGLLKLRRDAGIPGNQDVITRLTSQPVKGRQLNDEEIISILRNWTVGEISTIAAAVGVVAQYLAEHTDVQQQLRTQPTLLPDAIEEILRMYGPLLANRRVTTRAVEIGGRTINAGERISLNWVAANRDGRVFTDPQSFRLDREASANLLYGAGIHVCPGAPLARMELQVAVRSLLDGTTGIDPIAERPPTNAVYPASGFATLPLRITFPSPPAAHQR
ncbi:cytochrome P450 [Polaromonas sp.]|uniref:cytochrome P450 n=1 Tax=Polaromonas sp. TaxID=1869339 RepID=UPI0024876397|nr:cytochrome P450 [Polaromonas sp.]MDI1274493.1 cytochrome P450 [Polaromonas sp.]